MQGENIQVSQIVELAALVVMIDAAYILGAAYSPKPKSNPEAANPGEKTQLLKKFMEFNPELQRGMISYAERMRGGYRKGT